MADEKDKKEENKKVVNACEMSIPEIISALHQKALAEAQNDKFTIANSAIEVDGKTGKLKSAGEHIISVIKKDEKSEEKVAKKDAIQMLKTYVQWFVGPDLANKINDNVVLPLGGSSEDNKKMNESLSFLKFLNEEDGDNSEEEDDADQSSDSDDADFSEEGDDDDDSNEENGGDDSEEGDDDENSKDGDDDDTDDDKDGEKDKDSSDIGWYIAYNLKVEGLKQTALKDAMKKFAGSFFDTIEFKASSLFGGGGQSFTVKDAKNKIKDLFGLHGVDPDQLKSKLQSNIEKKFPDLKTNVNVEVRDKNTLLKQKDVSSKLDSKQKKSILASALSLLIQVHEKDPKKPFLNPRVVADLVTSSLKGMVNKLKHAVSKDDVIYLQNTSNSNVDADEIAKVEASIPIYEKIEGIIKKDIKDPDKVVTELEKEFDKIRKMPSFKYTINAKKIVSLWEKYYNQYTKEKETVKKDPKKFFDKFLEEYQDVLDSFKDDDDEDDEEGFELDESVTSVRLLNKHDIAKIILESLFEEEQNKLDEQPKNKDDAQSKDEVPIEEMKSQVSSSLKSMFPNNSPESTVGTKDDILNYLSKYSDKAKSAFSDQKYTYGIAIKTPDNTKMSESQFNDFIFESIMDILFNEDDEKKELTLDSVKSISEQFKAKFNNVELGDPIEVSDSGTMNEANGAGIGGEGDSEEDSDFGDEDDAFGQSQDNEDKKDQTSNDNKDQKSDDNKEKNIAKGKAFVVPFSVNTNGESNSTNDNNSSDNSSSSGSGDENSTEVKKTKTKSDEKDLYIIPIPGLKYKDDEDDNEW